MIWELPSALALLLKCFLFFCSDVHKNKTFFVFLLATFFLNICELLVIIRPGEDLAVLKLYYCASTLTVFYLVRLCSDISKSCHFIKNDFFLVATCIFVATIFLTNYIVADFTILPNGSLTRIEGNFYFSFQLYVVLFLIFAIVLLTRKALIKNDYELKIKCFIALLAFVPGITIIFVLMLMMSLGYKVNMAGFLSLATCFMLFMFISLNDKHRLFHMMRRVPYSREWKYYFELKKILKKLSLPLVGEKVDLKEVLKEIELLAIKNANFYFNTQKEVAQILNISESNLSRKVCDSSKKKEE